MPTRKNDAPEEPAAEPVEAAPTSEPTSVEPAEPTPPDAPPEERARAALTGERVTMTAAELKAVLAGRAGDFTPDEQGELRHLARQNRILVEDR